MKICSPFNTNIDNVAAGGGLKVTRDINGDFRAIKEDTGTFIGSWGTEAEAILEMGKYVDQQVKNLDGSLPFPTSGGIARQTNRIRPNDSMPMSKLREAVLLFEIGLGSIITPIGKFTNAVEALGGGMAKTLIYEPTQAVKRTANYIFGRTKFEALGGKTYQDTAHSLAEATSKLPAHERALPTLMNEALTREEIAKTNIVVTGGMNELNVNAAKTLAATGQAHNAYTWLRTNAMIDSFLANREGTLNHLLPEMQNAILEGKLPPEMQAQVVKLYNLAGGEDTVAKVVDGMKFTDDERNALFLTRTLALDDKFNFNAIYRYATAPELEAKFTSGAEQFAARKEMSKEAIKIGEDRMKLLRVGFENHAPGVSADQVIRGQLPIFRQAIDAGIFPGQFGDMASGAVKKYASVLNQLPEGNEILTRRVLSGHINPHELNPAINASKHIRNLVLREHVDPTVQKAILAIKDIPDERTRNILTKYIHDLDGRPGEGFQRLNQAIRTSARLIGVHVGDDVAERAINTLDYLTYASSIPFRPAIIARNYFQTTLNIPIVGGEAWKHGLEVSLGVGHGPEGRWKAMLGAMEVARKGGALKVDVVPLHGGQQALSTSLLSESKLANVGFKIKNLTDAGFSAYKSGDDWGRTVSFFAGRFRVNKYLPKFIAERNGNFDEALESFKINAKVKTFDETIEATFEAHIRAGQFDQAADLIGKNLADKVHGLYGDANHPSGWGGVTGRLFGQFGTFPIQYLHHVGEGLTRGTVKDRIEFLSAHTAVNAGIVYAGSQMGANLTSWAFLPSLNYTGGPYAELGINLVQAYGGSDAQKSLALRNLHMMLPRLNGPSIFVPGSYFMGDIQKAMGESTPGRQLARGLGVRLLEPGEQTIVDQGFGYILGK